MKTSELIKKLQESLDTNGDLELAKLVSGTEYYTFPISKDLVSFSVITDKDCYARDSTIGKLLIQL